MQIRSGSADEPVVRVGAAWGEGVHRVGVVEPRDHGVCHIERSEREADSDLHFASLWISDGMGHMILLMSEAGPLPGACLVYVDEISDSMSINRNV